MKCYNQEYIDILKDNQNLISIEQHKTNLVLHTVYSFTDTNTMLTLYILEGESKQTYLCDIGSIFDIADDLDLDSKIVEKHAKDFGLKIEQEKIYCTVDKDNLVEQLKNFLAFVMHIGLI